MNKISILAVPNDIPYGIDLRYWNHDGSQNYCPRRCGRSFKSTDKLDAHLKNGCEVRKKYVCPICPVKLFVKKENYKLHMGIKHGKIVH